ncbi:MAG: hypothetical protein IJ737_05060 [Ruminococcus sp.]|nr:hypothetical protein [Ruminococcus sp.]
MNTSDSVKTAFLRTKNGLSKLFDALLTSKLLLTVVIFSAFPFLRVFMSLFMRAEEGAEQMVTMFSLYAMMILSAWLTYGYLKELPTVRDRAAAAGVLGVASYSAVNFMNGVSDGLMLVLSVLLIAAGLRLVREKRAEKLVPVLLILAVLADHRALLLIIALLVLKLQSGLELTGGTRKLLAVTAAGIAAVLLIKALLPLPFVTRLTLPEYAGSQGIALNIYGINKLIMFLLFSFPLCYGGKRAARLYLCEGLIIIPGILSVDLRSFYLLLMFFAAVMVLSRRRDLKRYYDEVMSDDPRLLKAGVAGVIVSYVSYHFCAMPTDFIRTPFYVSYQQFGLIQRGLYGTIFQLLFGRIIPEGKMLAGYFAFLLFFFAAVVLLLTAVVKKAEPGRERIVVLTLVLLFLMSPGMYKYFIELSSLILTLLALFCLRRNDMTVWLTLPLVFICMLTHQIYASICFPLIFIIMVWRAFVETEGHGLRNGAVLVLNTLMVGVTFFYFTYFNAARIDYTMDEFSAVVYERSGNAFDPNHESIHYIFLDKEHTHAKEVPFKIPAAQRMNAIWSFAVNAPLLYLYVLVFLSSARREKSRLRRLAVYTAMISVFALLPPYLIDLDYGRWFGQYFTILILSVVFITLIQPEEKKWYRTLSPALMKTGFALLMLLVLIQQFSNCFMSDYHISAI